MEDTIGTIDRHVHIEYANNDQKTSEPKIFAKKLIHSLEMANEVIIV